MNSNDISILFAFTAGLLTFFSPCILPLIPSYLSFITGFSVDELMAADNKKILRTSVISSIFFVAGFSAVFIMFGLGASLIGQFLIRINDFIRVIGGIIIIFFGLVIMGVFRIKFLEIDKRVSIRNKGFGYIGALLVGMAFSFGWAPCVGPMLSSVLIVAESQQSVIAGFFLLLAYSMGLGIPIVISATAFSYLLSLSSKLKQYMNIVSIISGILLIILGLIVLMDGLGYVIAVITSIFG